MGLPDNVVFLPGAAEEFLRLRKSQPRAHAGVLAALRELARDGPPRGTCYVPVQEPPFPNTLAYRFDICGYAVVFECSQRIIMQTVSGVRVVRALRGGGDEPVYTIWAIIPPSA